MVVALLCFLNPDGPATGCGAGLGGLRLQTLLATGPFFCWIRACIAYNKLFVPILGVLKNCCLFM